MLSKQGGHELMNLQTGMVISRNSIWERPLTDLVIQAVEAMADEQGIKTLKITGRNKIPIYPANWIAGVEYDADNENEIDNEHNDEAYPEQEPDYDYDAELDDDEEYDRIDQGEIDEIMAKPGQGDQDPNPVNRIIQEVRMVRNDPAEIAVTDDEDTMATESSRPTRERREPERLTFFQTGTSHVTFEDKEWARLEQCHNLMAEVHPNPDEDREYTPQMAMVIARVMTDMNSKATVQGASFAQQYIVQ
jgi:hypothetical protein